ncbi:MAG TPA: glucose-1-phosphate cytidylyltransferase [Candidatus Goldiibacteriota bacterium]|nr:glucose-1-phosphate cytidylyltransferase [Candidatus Goldiibacteriota bacterium]HRQ44150.1 glucose-1-phosphate cytidylyltransferase [Candidatus Goldiibacteriota bacterium]
MKTVILAGGYGSRITEESHLKPKPMVEIGGMPILWHIMKYYSHFGFNDFVICCGYRGYVIKEYFANYYLHRSDITFDFSESNKMIVHSNVAEPWKVTLVDTGVNTMTGGRIKRIQKYIGKEPFMLTYGDGVADVDLKRLIAFHNKGKKTATITAVQPGGRFGALEINKSGRAVFAEKRKEDGGWINGGFMVLNPEIFDFIKDDNTVFEKQVLEKLGKDGKLVAYKHKGFWQCMDTLRDRMKLEELINTGNAQWIKWPK